MINIKDDYEAVHGAVTEAAPKVFLKYFYVNTKTGEKSGEMLATVKLGYSRRRSDRRILLTRPATVHSAAGLIFFCRITPSKIRKM